jgi:hypothetical protein
MASLLPNGKQQYSSAAGPMVGGKVFTYDAGTLVPRVTYSDAAGLVPNTNPVILDARGEATIFWSGVYKVVLKDSADNIIWTIDNVADLSYSGGSAQTGFVQEGVGALVSTVQAKLREQPVTPVEYGADITGVASCVVAFQRTMTAIAARSTNRKIRIPSGTYLFTVTGDADTIRIPSNVEIECDPGVVFKWGFWGSPLFANVNNGNVRWRGNGAQFIWTGAFGVTVGTLDKFGYGRAIPAYEWCAHIVGMGCDNVVIEDVKCAGGTAANNQNCFFSFRGLSGGGLSSGNKLLRINSDDVCLGAAWSEQDDFEISMVGGRYSSASAGLYGPGHVVYITAGSTPSQNGTVVVTDKATSRSGAYQAGGHSVSVKSALNVQVAVDSLRPEGALNYQDCVDVKFVVDHRTSDTTADGNGAIFAVNPSVGNDAVSIKAKITFEAPRNTPAINLSGIAASSSSPNCTLDADIVLTCNGTEAVAGLTWVGDDGIARVRYENKGSGAARAAITADKGSSGNIFHLDARGAVPNPRVTIGATGAPSDNLFFCNGDSTVDYDSNEFTPSSGNRVIWQGQSQYSSQQNLGVVVNPGGTFTLPKPGAYLINLEMKASDNNHSKMNLCWVVFDDASVNDWTSVRVLDTITKGAAAPTVLTMTVSAAGVCTVTSTAGANTWLMKYGYRQLSQD